MFIIPTGQLREKSIAIMFYIISTEIIEKILSREMKVTDLDYMICTWQDGFIIELLRWFDKKINEIPERKIDKRDPDNFYHWKTYYEQYIRIFYYFVIYRGIQDPKELRKIFKFLFTVNKKDNPYRNNYDMIFLDHMMPEMDGIETMHILRKLDGYNMPPIVALTANAITGMKEMYLKEGFDEYLSKPINITELDKLINKYFKK